MEKRENKKSRARKAIKEFGLNSWAVEGRDLNRVELFKDNCCREPGQFRIIRINGGCVIIQWARNDDLNHGSEENREE